MLCVCCRGDAANFEDSSTHTHTQRFALARTPTNHFITIMIIIIIMLYDEDIYMCCVSFEDMCYRCYKGTP